MDKDIKEMFDKKNKEIILTNLKYDLSRNIESMKDTIRNIFDREFDVAVKKILLMINDYYDINDFSHFSDSFLIIKKRIIDNLFINIDGKQDVLNSNLDNFEFSELAISNYYDCVIDSTSLLKNFFTKSWFVDIIDECIKLVFNIFSSYEDEHSIVLKNRLDDYVNNRFFDKIMAKLNEEFSLRDSNLINKADESYKRYLDICKNVVN